MSEIKDGGPAFPVECDWIEGQPQGRQTASHAGWHEGMTLRDYFAAKAMQAVVLKQNELHDIQAMYDRLALHAYKMADAMIEARSQS